MLTGNVCKDREYYNHLQKILMKMGINFVQKIHSGGLRLIVHNKDLFIFLESGLGMKYKARKTYEVKIPKQILLSEELTKSCLKGIFATDGSIFTSNKPGSLDYPSIEITTVSKNLSEQLKSILASWDFRVRMRFYDPKNNRYKRTYRISLNGYKMIRKWYEEIGVSHPEKRLKFNSILMGMEGFEPPTTRSSVTPLNGNPPNSSALPS